VPPRSPSPQTRRDYGGNAWARAANTRVGRDDSPAQGGGHKADVRRRGRRHRRPSSRCVLDEKQCHVVGQLAASFIHTAEETGQGLLKRFRAHCSNCPVKIDPDPLFGSAFDETVGVVETTVAWGPRQNCGCGMGGQAQWGGAVLGDDSPVGRPWLKWMRAGCPQLATSTPTPSSSVATTAVTKSPRPALSTTRASSLATKSFADAVSGAHSQKHPRTAETMAMAPRPLPRTSPTMSLGPRSVLMTL
jgi:hypothetical protein